MFGEFAAELIVDKTKFYSSLIFTLKSFAVKVVAKFSFINSPLLLCYSVLISTKEAGVLILASDWKIQFIC